MGRGVTLFPPFDLSGPGAFRARVIQKGALIVWSMITAPLTQKNRFLLRSRAMHPNLSCDHDSIRVVTGQERAGSGLRRCEACKLRGYCVTEPPRVYPTRFTHFLAAIQGAVALIHLWQAQQHLGSDQMVYGLGSFRDVRLKKRVRFCINAWWR